MEDDIKLPPEFISMNNTPVTVATIKRERMEEILREAVEADRQKRSEPEYRISACYFPKVGEVELTWERQYDGAEAHLTFKATPDQGERLVSVIGPCVYYTAAPQPNTNPQPTIPEGWQLVPKIPTKEMLLAGKHTIKGADTMFEGILAEYAYLSMLEAAPKFGCN